MQWAYYELFRIQSQRSALEAVWRNYLDLYRAPDTPSPRHFPFEGASNRTFPLAAMTVDPILARFLRTIHAQPNLWTLEPLNEKWQDLAKPLQDFLTWQDVNLIHMWDTNYRVLDEMLKLGTGVYKVGWRFEQHNITGYNKDLKVQQMTRQINQPVVDWVPLSHFLVPPEAWNLDPEDQYGAQFVAERQRWRPDQLAAISQAQNPALPNFDKDAAEYVIRFEEPALTEYQQEVAKLDILPQTSSLRWKRPIEVYEMHCRYDVDGNGYEEDIIVHFHWRSRTILRAIYNPFAHGKRPYHVVRYRRGDGFYGIGICEQAKMWQDSVSDVLNFNIDKILLSNAPMLGIKEGANVLPNEQIFPGKIWPLINPKEDIVPLFLTGGDVVQIPQLLAFLQETAKQRTGVTDLQFGSIGQLPSRTPATTVQALLQEGNTRFDMSIQDLRLTGLNHVGLQILQNLVQQIGNVVNNPDGQQYVSLAARILGQEGRFLPQVLRLPFQEISEGIGVTLTATSGTANKELIKQSNLALLQLYSQLGPGFLQLAQVIQQMPGTPVATVAQELFAGGAEFLKRTLEQFDVRNPDEVVPSLQALLSAQSAVANGQPISPLGGPGGIGGTTNASGGAGMEGPQGLS